MHHINDLLPSAMAEIDNRFEQRQRDWNLVKRNAAITARNRNMQMISEMLGMEYIEKQLEKPEQAA